MKRRSIFLAKAFWYIGIFWLVLLTCFTPNIHAQERLPIRVSQYVAFLNDTAKITDPYHLYDEAMKGFIKKTINRQEQTDYFSYYCVAGTENNPTPYLNSKTALLFCNWLENQSSNKDSSFSVQEAVSNNIFDKDSLEANNETSNFLTDQIEDTAYSIKSNTSQWSILIKPFSSSLGIVGLKELEGTASLESQIFFHIIEPLIGAFILSKLHLGENFSLILDCYQTTSPAKLSFIYELSSLFSEKSDLVSCADSRINRPSDLSATTFSSVRTLKQDLSPMHDSETKTHPQLGDDSESDTLRNTTDHPSESSISTINHQKQDPLRYSKKLATDYVSHRHKYNETDAALFETLKKIGLQGKIVLDVGCGGGKDLERISHMGGITIGFDVSSTMLKQNSLQDSLRVFMANGANTLPLRDHSIDIVFSNFVFHYIQNSDQFFRELSRVLTPEGKIVATFNISEVKPGYENLYNTPMPIRLGGELVVQNLIKSRAEIENAIKQAGFSIEKEEELEHPNAVIDPHACIASQDLANGRHYQDVVEKKAMLFVLKKH